MKFLFFLFLPSISFSQVLRQSGTQAATLSASTITATTCLRTPADGTTFEAGCDATTNTGIGTASPAYKMDVSGALRATGQIIGQSTASITGNAFSIGGSSFTVSQGSATVAYDFNAGGNVLIVSTNSIRMRGNDQGINAAVGYVGEYISTACTAGANAPTSTQYGDCSSASLTAGDWDCSINYMFALNGATLSGNAFIGIGTVAGNDSTGLTNGVTQVAIQSGSNAHGGAMSGIRKNITATTTFYFKHSLTYTGGPPQTYGQMQCRRIR